MEPILTFQANHLDALQGILEEQIRQYEAILDALSRKQQILVSGKAQGLEGVDRELLNAGHKAAQLEQDRQTLQLAMACPDWTLETLIGHVQSSAANGLRQARMRLVRLLRDTERLNRENGELLQLSLSWIRDTVEVITASIQPEGASYTAQGGKTRKQNADTPPNPLQSTISHSA